jgi:hypothetical protein
MHLFDQAEPTSETNSPPTDWRGALPARGWPVLLYAALMLAMLFGLSDLGAESTRFGYYQVNSPYWGGFAVLVALIAMLKVQIRYRLLMLLVVELFRLFIRLQITAVDTILFSNWSDYGRVLGNQLAIDVVDFAFISTVAHAITSLFGARVSSQTPDAETLQRSTQAGIAEWLYFTLIVGLIFLPQPSWIYSAQHMTWEPFGWNSIYRLIVYPPSRAMIPLLGLLLLSQWRGWRFALFLIALIAAILAFGILIDVRRFWGVAWRRIPPTMLGHLVWPYFLSAPFWLLIRWAGYRLYSPRRWIYSPVVRNLVDPAEAAAR